MNRRAGLFGVVGLVVIAIAAGAAVDGPLRIGASGYHQVEAEPEGDANSADAYTMGTAFTYQGRLTDANGPANGLYDFQFTLHDADSGPNSLVGDPNGVTAPNVSVANGTFTTDLDFGDGAFNGNARWLEIGVRHTGDPNDYTLLAPRQPIRPTPYALHLPHGTIPVANVQDFGAVADGATNDRAAFQKAIDYLSGKGGGTLCIPSSEHPYRIGVDPSDANALTIPPEVAVAPQPSAVLSIDSDVTVIFGRFIAGLHRVFDGAGSVEFAPGAVKEVYPEWWGAVADGSTDCSDAINKAITSGPNEPDADPNKPARFYSPRVRFSPGTYSCSDIVLSQEVALVGSGKKTTFLENNSTEGKSTLNSRSGQETYGVTIRDLGFRFATGGSPGYAIKFTGVKNSTIEDFFIETPPNRNEQGGIYLGPDPSLPSGYGCWLNTIAKGKIYVDQVAIKLDGQQYEGAGVNENYFRDGNTSAVCNLARMEKC